MTLETLDILIREKIVVKIYDIETIIISHDNDRSRPYIQCRNHTIYSLNNLIKTGNFQVPIFETQLYKLIGEK